jgi:hypothetical protein
MGLITLSGNLNFMELSGHLGPVMGLIKLSGNLNFLELSGHLGPLMGLIYLYLIFITTQVFVLK